MNAVTVRLGPRSYAIRLTSSYRQLPAWLEALRLEPWGCIVSHPSLLRRFGRELIPPLRRAGWHLRTIAVPESERSKSSAMAERVIRRLARQSAMRVPVLFAFGGGVIGDLAGFVAAVFRRGVPYVQLPTTLLAQVDSGIGGKVGVDLPTAKNAVGAFYQPRLVVNHLGLLTHLPPRQRRSGVSEIIKYAAIGDPALFRYLEDHLTACLRGELRADRVMVERCVRIKARVVSQDEQETSGRRTILNFGHTLGHALEAATAYRRFTHGEAIAVGMACASALGVAMGVTPRADHARLSRLLKAAGLPTRASGVPLAAVRRALVHDKKFLRGTMRWVLMTRVGRVLVSESVSPSVMWPVIRHHVT
ncbi:MAG: 3-dehydroquinate synthase [Candidatus Omnitrophica bacterium]|nr:3-dehydroquinate synthase [Candidatus Omnitrophota bacterium]